MKMASKRADKKKLKYGNDLLTFEKINTSLEKRVAEFDALYRKYHSLISKDAHHRETREERETDERQQLTLFKMQRIDKNVDYEPRPPSPKYT